MDGKESVLAGGGRPLVCTVFTDCRHPWLGRPEAVNRLRAAFRYARARRPFVIDAAVVLPDRVHAVWRVPEDDPAPGPRWHLIKTHCTRHLRGWPGLPRGRLWAKGYQARVIDPAAWGAWLDWLHYEPVRLGFVPRPDGWPYSSYRRWRAAGRYPCGWPASPPDSPVSLLQSPAGG